jgi:uncharacterized protein
MSEDKIDLFLKVPAFAVVGASDNPEKFGYKVYKTYLRHGMKAYPVNNRLKEIEGQAVFQDLASLPEKVEAISIITPPPVTDKVVDDAIASGVKHIWMQPGAESPEAIKKAEDAGLNVIHSGPCILVVLN